MSRKKSAHKKLPPVADKRPINYHFGLIIFICVIVTALVIPAFSSFKDDMDADQIIKLIDHIKKACELFHFDIGSYPLEYSDVAYVTYLAHNLSRPTGSEQWNGPYIRQLLTNRDNPFGGSIRLYNYIDYANGFDLDADDIIETRGDGNFIVFQSIPARVAKKINDRLETKTETKNWMTSGKVKYSEKSGSLSVYLIGG